MGEGKPGCPTAPEMCPAPSSGGQDTKGCPARGSPRVLPAELATCEHSRGRQRGPGTRQESGRPLPTPRGGSDICALLRQGLGVPANIPRARGLRESRCSTLKGPIPATVLLSRVRGVKPAALTARCSIPDFPLQSVPLLTMGCSHTGHAPGPAEPVPRVQGAPAGAPAQPREPEEQRSTAGTGAAGTRHVLPTPQGGLEARQLHTSVCRAPAPLPLHPNAW